MLALSHLIILFFLLLHFPSILSQAPLCPCKCFHRSNIQVAIDQCKDPLYFHCRLGICTRPNNAQSRHCCNPTNIRTHTPSPSIYTASSIPATPSSTPSIPNNPSSTTSITISSYPSPAIPTFSSICPCECFSRRFSTSAFGQCDFPQFAACTVSFCTRPNGSISRQCCDRHISETPSPSISPSASPSPPPAKVDLICPCVCLNPENKLIANNQCNRFRFSRCKVQDCTLLDGRISKHCCRPRNEPLSVSPSASPTLVVMSAQLCPCICRTGVVRVQAAEKECRNEFYRNTCRVEECRSGVRSGAACCDGSSSIVKPSASPKVIVYECPCKCRTGLFAEDSGRTECNTRAIYGNCAVRKCFRGRRRIPGFKCC